MKNKIIGLTKTRKEKTRLHIAIKMPDPPLLFLRKQIVKQCRLAGLLAWFTAEHLPVAPGRHSGMKIQQVRGE
jgi:hypothetical protein